MLDFPAGPRYLSCALIRTFTHVVCQVPPHCISRFCNCFPSSSLNIVLTEIFPRSGPGGSKGRGRVVGNGTGPGKRHMNVQGEEGHGRRSYGEGMPQPSAKQPRLDASSGRDRHAVLGGSALAKIGRGGVRVMVPNANVRNVRGGSRDEREEEDEEEVSAYQKLMDSLRRRGEHRVELEQRRKEEEGVEALGDDCEGSESDDDAESVSGGEGGELSEGEGSEDSLEAEDVKDGVESEVDDDRERAREELGLDAMGPDDDEESVAGDEGDDSVERAVDEDEGVANAFARCFTRASISEQDAARAQSAREGTKWRKKEVDGLPRGILFRPGLEGRELPSAVQEGGEDDIGISPGLLERMLGRVSNYAEGGRGSLSALQRGILPLMTQYLDLMYTARSPQTADELRDAMILHVLNHVIKSRDAVLRNNERLKKKSTDEARDQGYTRGKVLVLLPCRNSAWAFVRRLLALYPGATPPAGRVDGEERFKEEFGPGDKAEREADTDRLGKVGPDHFERFHGNNDDHFRFGIQLHKKYARLFAPFYSVRVLCDAALPCLAFPAVRNGSMMPCEEPGKDTIQSHRHVCRPTFSSRLR